MDPRTLLGGPRVGNGWGRKNGPGEPKHDVLTTLLGSHGIVVAGLGPGVGWGAVEEGGLVFPDVPLHVTVVLALPPGQESGPGTGDGRPPARPVPRPCPTGRVLSVLGSLVDTGRPRTRVRSPTTVHQ